jgi:hypothetical protein
MKRQHVIVLVHHVSRDLIQQMRKSRPNEGFVPLSSLNNTELLNVREKKTFFFIWVKFNSTQDLKIEREMITSL